MYSTHYLCVLLGLRYAGVAGGIQERVVDGVPYQRHHGEGHHVSTHRIQWTPACVCVYKLCVLEFTQRHSLINYAHTFLNHTFSVMLLVSHTVQVSGSTGHAGQYSNAGSSLLHSGRHQEWRGM